MNNDKSLSNRKILHIDMDAFYAAVEQMDHPEWKGKPVIVGGKPNSRGVVCTCSYEARKFGVRSAMPSHQAYKLCPEGIFVHPRFDRYLEISQKVMKIFRSLTDKVEPLSLDEAYLDVTINELGEPHAQEVAKYILEKIKNDIGITASAGVGPNKMIAKIASDINKPNGLTVVPPHKVHEFLNPLPIEKISGVGPKTKEKLYEIGIKIIHDVQAITTYELEAKLGKFGPVLKRLSQGIDKREVKSSRKRKSIGSERTLRENVLLERDIIPLLKAECEDVWDTLRRKEKKGSCVTVKVKYFDFQLSTRSHTLSKPLSSYEEFINEALVLLPKHSEIGKKPIRLIGVQVSHFLEDNEGQPSLPFD